LRREITLFEMTLLGVGMMVGGGIFAIIGLGAHLAGPSLILSFAIVGIGVIFVGLCYAELGSRLAHSL
jgi:APA family basic amino acid/polyamine antiporter